MSPPSSSPTQRPTSAGRAIAIALGSASLSTLLALAAHCSLPWMAGTTQQQVAPAQASPPPYLLLALRSGCTAPSERHPRTRTRKSAPRVAT
ncbi:hypothetical protein [Herbaspirillum sp. YR522]|uniref:hypothetical protein n=1 Tax=Herbaspirillum sp. YR522 TaxID=1144342 RepID=UPI0002D7700E|nr:hypothetical protein [Herbaspirillum sp. YR522]